MTHSKEEDEMGTIEVWEAEEIYDVAHSDAKCDFDRHPAGLLAVAAEAERRGRAAALRIVDALGDEADADRVSLRQSGNMPGAKAAAHAMTAYRTAAKAIRESIGTPEHTR